MPLFICIIFAPLLIALLVALKASGRKRVLAWCVFALLALPLSVGGAGGWLLSLRGLAWRSGVKLPVGTVTTILAINGVKLIVEERKEV